jgi:hypothetical protein
MVDRTQQDEYDALLSIDDFVAYSDQMRKVAYEKGMKERNPNSPYRQKNILSLSGGGSFGAFSAGIVCGWTARGDRPNFDVVTRISTRDFYRTPCPPARINPAELVGDARQVSGPDYHCVRQRVPLRVICNRSSAA